jgi:hypothetical protein
MDITTDFVMRVGSLPGNMGVSTAVEAAGKAFAQIIRNIPNESIVHSVTVKALNDSVCTWEAEYSPELDSERFTYSVYTQGRHIAFVP